jgi:hypothetical protein
MAIVMGGMIAILVKGCGLKPKERIIIEQQEPQRTTCDGLELGGTERLECPEDERGFIMNVCTPRGMVEASNTCEPIPSECPGDRAVTWVDDVEPIIVGKCASCHYSPSFRIDDYEVAKEHIEQILDRVTAGDNNPEIMPPEQLPPLDSDSVDKLIEWRNDGALFDDDCPQVDTGADFRHLDFDYIEAEILRDLGLLNQTDKVNTFYLVATHKYDAGDPATDMLEYVKAMNKGSNSLQVFDDQLYLPRAIDKRRTIYRLDQRSYGIENDEWNLIEDEDKVDIESFTDTGELIKFLTHKRKPWMHFDNFLFVVNQPKVYYDITETPFDCNELLLNVGVDVEAQLAAFEPLFFGFNGSPISIQKNRLVVRYEGTEGYVYVTYDPVALDGVPERNLFEFPLIDGAGSILIFDFAASEIIYAMPNGLQGYALCNAQNILQDAAPLDVVQDNEGIEAEIENALDCHRCHTDGLRIARDQISPLLAEENNFDAADAQIIAALYRGNRAVEASFSRDNGGYALILEQLGSVPGQLDPINFSTDRLRLDWTLEEIAAFLFLTPDEFRERIEFSNDAKAQIGQILDRKDPGTVTFDQLVDVLPTLIADLLLFQEQLGD